MEKKPLVKMVPAIQSAGLQLAGKALREGEALEFDIPITDKALLKTVKEAYARDSAKVRALVAVPAGFKTTAQSQPMLIVSSTSDGAASSIGQARDNDFMRDTLAKGFVLLAVDGEFGRPENGERGKGDSEDFRWAIVSAALVAMRAEWPASKAWPIATAGISGGGGYASHQALMLVDAHEKVIGLFLGVSPWTPVDFPEALRRAPKAALHRVPVFMSAGAKDETVKPPSIEKAFRKIQGEGFKKLRREEFGGGHELFHPHLAAALEWFLAEGGK